MVMDSMVMDSMVVDEFEVLGGYVDRNLWFICDWMYYVICGYILLALYQDFWYVSGYTRRVIYQNEDNNYLSCLIGKCIANLF